MENNLTARAVRLGEVVMSRAAHYQLMREDVFEALSRHAAGDWGDVSPEDAAENDHSLREGLRLLSSYRDRRGTKFWIITEADRTVTTVLLPEDY